MSLDNENPLYLEGESVNSKPQKIKVNYIGEDLPPPTPHPVKSVNTKTGDVVLDKSDIGLSNVDNTSDLEKPVSILTQQAIADALSDIAPGRDGADGADGNDGAQGAPGAPGQDGRDGLDEDQVNDLIDAKVDDLNDIISQLTSDGFITPSEKIIISTEIEAIIKEYPSFIIQLDINNLYALKISYIDIYDQLIDYITPILNSPDSTTPINPSEFKSKFSAYYEIRAEILKTIALYIKSYQDQADATVAEIQTITNFWQVTVGDNLIAGGTMLVGTEFYNNAGMTGVTDSVTPEKSVRFWAGAPFVDRDQAPFRVMEDGTWFSGDSNASIDFGVTRPNTVSISGALFVDGGGNSSDIVIWRGIWTVANTYYKDNYVSHNGGLWIYKSNTPSSGNEPSKLSGFWDVYVAAPDETTNYEYRYKVNKDYDNPPILIPSDLSNPAPAGWSTVVPVFNIGVDFLWRIVAKKNSDGSLVGIWSQPIPDSAPPARNQIIFKSLVFKRSTEELTIPPLGGSFNYPVPDESTGWYDGVPPGTATLWASHRIFTSDGQAPQQIEWSIPQIMADTPELDYEWSSIKVNPGTPTTNPLNWNNDPLEESIWQAFRIKNNGVWGEWTIIKIKGENGKDGVNGGAGSVGPAGPPGPSGATQPGVFNVNRGTYDENKTYWGGSDYIETVDYKGINYFSNKNYGTIAPGLSPSENCDLTPDSENCKAWTKYATQMDTFSAMVGSVVDLSVKTLAAKAIVTEADLTKQRIEINRYGDNDMKFYRAISGGGTELALRLDGDGVWMRGNIEATSGKIGQLRISNLGISMVEGEPSEAPTQNSIGRVAQFTDNNIKLLSSGSTDELGITLRRKGVLFDNDLYKLLSSPTMTVSNYSSVMGSGYNTSLRPAIRVEGGIQVLQNMGSSALPAVRDGLSTTVTVGSSTLTFVSGILVSVT